MFGMLAATAVASNAQFFVEGNVGAGFSGGSSSLDGVTVDNPSSSSFTVSPLVGYRLNEKTAFGVKASFTRSTRRYITTDMDTGEEVLYENKYSGWGSSVFNRYQLWGTKKFSFNVESSAYMSKVDHAEKIGLTSTWNFTRFEYGIHAAPLIAYDLSDRFSITFSSDFLSIRLCALTVNNRDTGIETKTYHFDFNAQSAILNSLGEIRIGLIYHFKASDK